jgi:hypothetical protein
MVSLIERQARELAEYREAAAVWQERARTLEQRLLAIGTGETPPETALEAVESPQANETEPQGFWDRVRRFWRG